MKYKQSKNSRLLSLEKDIKVLFDEVFQIKKHLDEVNRIATKK